MTGRIVRTLEALIFASIPVLIGLVITEILGLLFGILLIVGLCVLWIAVEIRLRPASPNLRLTPRRLRRCYEEHYPPHEGADVLRYREPESARDHELPCAVVALANPRHGSGPRTQIEARWHDEGNPDEFWVGPASSLDHWFNQALKIYKTANPRATDGKLVRLMDVCVSPDRSIVTCILKKSRFLKYAATNCSADLRLRNDTDRSWTTVRDEFEPGPRLHALPDTQAGNVLGVNLLVVTKDSQLILKLRQPGGVAHRIGELDSSGSGAIDLRHDLKDNSKVRGIVARGAVREFRDEVGEDIPIDGEVEFLGLCREFSRLGQPDAFFFARTPFTFEKVKEEWEKRPREHEEGKLIPRPFKPDEPKDVRSAVRFSRSHLTSPLNRFRSKLPLSRKVVSIPLAIHLVLLGLYLGHLKPLSEAGPDRYQQTRIRHP